ncbi:TIGR03364 family FAD-dependent oxidoreductase [Glutamicibacter arilaitensis]|uniref:TIGR03364 family FAD-dependent oxidoreductase n=1 Tax=Glutamicibacter arilaitensis TaxID=256701 RepID=A0A4Y8TUX1_9MICC|nr:TIGR03364 family FAD-dependent oxidoreductase [Glutamicibacter arilaitensis]
MITVVSKEKTSPQTQPRANHADVLVIGAGIVGMAHAARSLDAGLSVIVIDRDHEAVGASVRNFGHCCITAQSGELYDLAQSGRPLWLDYAERAGFWAVESGAVVVATTETELQVLRELSARRVTGQVEMLNAQDVAEQLGRESTEGILGGAFLRDDLRVDPRTTVAKLAQWVDAHVAGSVQFNTSALGFGAGKQRRASVHTNRGSFEADQVFICVGHDVDYLFPQIAQDHQITRCALQMLRAEASEDLEVKPAVLTATSMLRYEAFTEVPAAQALQAEVLAEHPELLSIQANVMFTQRPDGTLLMGDSHSYAATQAPFLKESTSETLHSAIAGYLQGTELKVIERWQGIYASSAVAPLLIRNVADAITIVSVTAGVGMTLSFGLADKNVNEIAIPAIASPINA